MKNITESLSDIQGITPYLKGEEPINEGLKDVLKKVKDKFKQVFTYLKGVVARFGTYFLGTNENGDVVNAISPLTAGAAYAGGEINKNSTLVVMDKEGAKITGCKTKYDDAKKLYSKSPEVLSWVGSFGLAYIIVVLQNKAKERKAEKIRQEKLRRKKLKESSDDSSNLLS